MLSRISLQVEQLFPVIAKMENQFVAGVANREQPRSDAIIRPQRICTAVHNLDHCGLAAKIARTQVCPSATPFKFSLRSNTEKVEERGSEVKQAERCSDASGRFSGDTHQQRHANKFLGQLHWSVVTAAMLEKLFAVVGSEHKGCIRPRAEFKQSISEAG